MWYQARIGRMIMDGVQWSSAGVSGRTRVRISVDRMPLNTISTMPTLASGEMRSSTNSVTLKMDANTMPGIPQVRYHQGGSLAKRAGRAPLAQ